MSESELEGLFIYWWNLLAPQGVPQPEREYRFDPTRRWKADFAFTNAKVLVELEGGVFSNGRHTRGKGYEADLEKYNAATSQGWCVFRFSRGMLERDPEAAIKQVLTAVVRLKCAQI